jgi:membrane-associated phospholipid phosphatase
MDLVVVTLVSVTTALLTAVLLSRWPRSDPAAPHLAPEVVREEVRSHPRLRRALRSRLDAEAATGLALSLAVGAIVIAVAGVGLLLRMVRTNTGFARNDLALARWGVRHATPQAVRVLRDISLLGGAQVLVVLAAVVLVVDYRRWRSRAVVPFLVLTVGGQFAVANLIKWLVDRPRPDLARLTGFSGSSFPSGHATAAAASFAVFALLLGRGRARRTKIVLASCAAGIAVGVGTTRILLGVHWFTDVLAGLLTGWGWFALCSIAFGGSILRFGAPVEVAQAAADATRTGDDSHAGAAKAG